MPKQLSKDTTANLPEVLSSLNRLVHEPARLAILTVLAAWETADFTFLQTATALTRGNLSVQLSRLEESQLVSLQKAFLNKKSRTTISITILGRSQLESYWRSMEEVRRSAQR